MHSFFGKNFFGRMNTSNRNRFLVGELSFKYEFHGVLYAMVFSLFH